jgi:hypothetical protein
MYACRLPTVTVGTVAAAATANVQFAPSLVMLLYIAMLIVLYRTTGALPVKRLARLQASILQTLKSTSSADHAGQVLASKSIGKGGSAGYNSENKFTTVSRWLTLS